MSTFIPNSFQHPNIYVDALMHLLTPEENLCLTFAARQILGWDESRNTLRAKIAFSVFESGYSVQGTQVCHGTGLSHGTVLKCVNALVEYGILNICSDPKKSPKGIEYEINFDSTRIDWVRLRKRREQAKKARRNQADNFKGVQAVNREGNQAVNTLN